MAYSDKEKTEIIDSICNRVADGESLRNVLSEKGCIDKNTFYIWVRQDEAKAEQYARACNDRTESIFEDMIEIADDARNDWMEKFDNEGKSLGYVLNGEHVQRSKLRIDTRKWKLSKLNPKKFGDKIDVTSDNKPIAPTQIIFTDDIKDV